MPDKAYIALIQPEPAGHEFDRVTFMYNPKEFSYKKSGQWAAKPAKGAKVAPPPEFNGPQPMSLTVEVFLDAYETGHDIQATIDKLTSCCVPLADTLTRKKPSPPWVLFGWGHVVHLTAFVQSVDVKVTLFDTEGKPLRASCTVAMQEIPEEVAKQNPTSGSLTTNTVRAVRSGDTLASIAYEEYRQPAAWRGLATVNNIDDPLRLPPGTRLLVPDIDEMNAAMRSREMN
jgi:hypothetical protein